MIEKHENHVELDLSGARRLIACGDVHGHLGLLLDGLRGIGFDAGSGDRLICLGDWIDRGDDVLEIRDWLLANPTVRWCRGNHEDILDCATHEGRWIPKDKARRMHGIHGGDWMRHHLVGGEPSDEIIAFSEMLNAAPVAWRVRTPGGRDVGFVHGEVPTGKWSEMAGVLNGPEPARSRMANECLWSKERAGRVLGHSGPPRYSVPDIDHVFFGHTIVGREPFVHGNLSYIDTGAYKYGTLTVVDVDEWIAGHP